MRRKLVKANGWKLVLMAFVTGVLLVGFFWIRAAQTSASDTRICRKVDKLDSALLGIVGRARVAPKPGEYGYAYWRNHPNERIGRPGTKNTRGALDRALADLRKAACDPTNLPSTTGGRP